MAAAAVAEACGEKILGVAKAKAAIIYGAEIMVGEAEDPVLAGQVRQEMAATVPLELFGEDSQELNDHFRLQTQEIYRDEIVYSDTRR